MEIRLPPTTIALFSRSADLGFLTPVLQAAAPALEVVVWPDPRCARAEVALGWDAPPGLYEQMPKLRLVHSMAAGVDNLLAGQDLRGISVCRVVDPQLAQGMVEYVLWGALYFHRGFDAALRQQQSRYWERPAQIPAQEFPVGILGLGELGRAVAQALLRLGYPVNGWSRSGREIPGVRSYVGADGLSGLLGSSRLLVCLLPLTASTRGILNRDLFRQLPPSAAVIQCGRGEQLVEADLLAAVQDGHLRGALLDVFEHEPLAADHPLWAAPGVIVTPHMATMASTDAIVKQVLENMARLYRGEPLLNRIDAQRGY